MRRPILQSRFNPTPILIESCENPHSILCQSRINNHIPIHTIKRQSCTIGGTNKKSVCVQWDLQSSDNPAPIHKVHMGTRGAQGVQYCFNWRRLLIISTIFSARLQSSANPRRLKLDWIFPVDNPAPILLQLSNQVHRAQRGGWGVGISEVKALPLCTYNPYNRATIERQSCTKNYKNL